MEQNKKSAKGTIALWVGIVCIGIYIVNYYLRNMLSVTTPELLQSGKFTEESVALLSSIYMVFYAGGQLVNGFLGDMLSPKLMILGGIGHRKNLLLCEPLAQHLVCAYYAGRVGVMLRSAITQSRIVVGSHDIDHLLIHIKASGELCAALDNLKGMVAAVTTIEVVVERKYVLFDVCDNLLTYHNARFLLAQRYRES